MDRLNTGAHRYHPSVLQSLYALVDRRHGSDGETVAGLAVRKDTRFVDELDLRDRFRRDLDADRAISVAKDLRYHAVGRELVTDGGVDQRTGGDDRPERSFGDGNERARRRVPLTWCAAYTNRLDGLDTENFAEKSQPISESGHNPDDDLTRIADAPELQNALLPRLVQDLCRDAVRNDSSPDRSEPSDRAIATNIVDLYGGSVAGCEFGSVSNQIEDTRDR